MAGVQSPTVLAQIQGVRNFTEHAAGLRALRDEITGHVQRKERRVQQGVLDVLVKTLQNSDQPPSHVGGKERSSRTDQPGALSEDEVVRLLSLQLLASFAYGGAAFLGALHAVGVVPAILPALSPLDNPPQIVLAALRVLKNITASARLGPPGTDDTSGLSDILFSQHSVDLFCAILSQESADAAVQEQKRLVASLISQLCKGPTHQNALAESGVLDALATMLASFVVARGEVVPGAELLGQSDGLVSQIPAPAPPGADLALVLEALSTIIVGSRFRSCLLLWSPAILAVLPSAPFSPPVADMRAAWNALEDSGYGNMRARSPGAMDYLLPAVPVPQFRSQGSRFAEYPPLGYTMSRDNLAASGRSSIFKFTGWDSIRFDGPGEDADADESESPLVPWLIHLVRSTDGLERVMAASLVTSLFKASFACPEREQALAVLVVPLLCQLLKEHDKEIPASVRQSAFVDPDTARHWAIQERAAEVLARLVGESETLQKAAFECGVIKLVAKLLKDSYDPQPVQTPARPWTPTLERGADFQEGPPSCRVGPQGQVPAHAHKIRMRESMLKLVAGMATLSHDYREALVKHDVVVYIVESLSPVPAKPRNAKEKPASEQTFDNGASEDISPYGHNPNAVIMAACHAVRALARRPSILRTTLQDHGVSLPIFRLLRHPDAEVQIAASSAVINLVTNCSPMVDTLLEAGIVKTLCDHAHSLNPGLRLNALWALKHLVTGLDNDLRKQCLQELGPGWLVQLISNDASEEEGPQARGPTDRRAATTANVEEEDDDEDMDAETPYEDHAPRSWTWAALARPTASPTSPRLQQAYAKLTALRDAELNPTRRARSDSLAIQEQGLGFVRNLIMLPNPAEQTDMVDYLFAQLGEGRLFAILADKLKVRVVGAFARRHHQPHQPHPSHQFRLINNNPSTSSSSSTAAPPPPPTISPSALVVYPQARVVENLAYILVHIAAAAPRHRQLVVAQTDLLKLLGGHLSSKDAGVRKAICQLFMNLSWMDSDADRGPWSQRALELERMGFLAKLEGLEQGDADLSVRERAKAAVAQMKTPTA